ncbi:MAG TPA: hypothetical protein VHF22_04965, partial [Planctomycetota bacterium]|nr:hypothetical protein [Planctomycetota bacterium]
PDRWLGGSGAPGAPLGGAEGIRRALGDGFALEREERLLFFIPWHDRSGQVARAHAQRFRRLS